MGGLQGVEEDCGVGTERAPCTMHREMNKMLRVNKESHGNDGFLPRKSIFAEGNDPPWWQKGAPITRRRGQRLSCGSAGGSAIINVEIS